LIGIVIAFIFAATGAWYHIWLLFGGSNQLLAGLALMLASVYLVRAKKPAYYTLIPAIFMIITCEAALVWEAYVFFSALIGPLGYYAQTGSLVQVMAAAGNPLPAIALTWTFLGIAIILFFLGWLVFADAWASLRRGPEAAEASVEVTAPAQ